MPLTPLLMAFWGVASMLIVFVMLFPDRERDGRLEAFEGAAGKGFLFRRSGSL